MQRFFLNTMVVWFLLSMSCSSFAMIIQYKNEENKKALHELSMVYGKRIAIEERKKFEKLPLEEQGWRNIKRLYENSDNPVFVKNFLLDKKNYVPIIFINQSPIYTQENRNCIVINPYNLPTDAHLIDSELIQSQYKKVFDVARRNFIQKIQQKKLAMGLNTKEDMKHICTTSYKNDWLLMKAVLFGDKDDVVQVVDSNIKDNVKRKVVKHALNQAITVAIDCPHVKSSILELLLWEKKKFHAYAKFTSKEGLKALDLLAIATKNKKAFDLVVTIDPYNQHNKYHKYKGENECKTILDRMYEDDNFDEKHIQILRDKGGARFIELGVFVKSGSLEREQGLNNLKKLYGNQNPRFVRKFLGDAQNDIPVYIINTEDKFANEVFFGSMITPYEKSFYSNPDEHYFDDKIIAIGRKQLDESLKGEALFYDDLIDTKSLDINNILVKATAFGTQQDIEKELMHNITQCSNNKNFMEDVNRNVSKAIGASIYFSKAEVLKLLLYEQKMLLRNHSGYYDNNYRGKVSYLLLSVNHEDGAQFELISIIDPYNANRLLWKDDNENEYKTNLDRLISNRANPSRCDFFADHGGGMTAEQVFLYNKQLVADIVENLPSRNDLDTYNGFNRILNDSQWNWVQKRRLECNI